jgi:hypothetical protein
MKPRWFHRKGRSKMKMVQITRAKFITVDEAFKIEYFSFKGGESAWIISSRRANDFYFAVDHAKTLELAKEKLIQLSQKVGA